jgi:hypothetical protein
MPGRPPVSLPPSTAVIELSREELDAKVAAFKRHTSQAPLFPFFEQMVHNRGRQELFHLVAASTPRKLEVEKDLFAGVKE